MRAPRMLLALLASFALVVGVIPTAHADDTTATYIVELKDGVSAQKVIPGLLGPDAKVLDKAISGGIATLTATQAKALEANPYVKSVRVDKVISSTGTRVGTVKAKATVTSSSVQSGAPWDLDILDSRTASLDGNYTALNTGSGVSVFVVDTGIYRAHSQFSGLTVAAGYDFVDGDTDPGDCDGQGTAVASLIGGSTLGAAKGVTLVPLRVLDCNGSGYASGLLSALDYVIAHHTAGTPAIVDIGLGTDALNDVDAAVQSVINAGITVVVAADYANVDACLSSPGRATAAITVAGSNSSNAEAANTSYGSCIDMYAPGQDVSIADITGTTATATGSGTAYAAGLVAGVAAQVLHTNPTWTPAQVSAQLVAAATSGKITNARSVNRLVSLGLGFEAFVKASYQDFLGRQPTAAELAAQSSVLSSGALSKASYLSSLSRSDEWLTAIVTKMYRDTLNRDPDPNGLADWVSWLRSGRFTVAQAASLFYSSNEYFTVTAHGDTSTWVQLLYQKLLTRTADSAGLPFWIANAGTYGKDWVAYNFYQSQETRMRRVEVIYQTLLFREPDAVGWPFWTARVLSTGDLQLAWEVANSDEYWDKAHTRY